MGKIKKFFGENFSSNFKMKIIFAKNAFGGHYAEKILIFKHRWSRILDDLNII